MSAPEAVPPKAPPSLADLLDGVRWDYDPKRRQASPLLPTVLYFQDFPWDGEEPGVGAGLGGGVDGQPAL